MKQADPNSNRSKKRAKREFKGSRPNRRAERRLEDNLKAYEDVMRNPAVDDVVKKGFHKPGAMKRW